MGTDSFKLSSFLSQGQTVDNFENEIVLLESPSYERWYDFPFSVFRQPFGFWKIFQEARRLFTIGLQKSVLRFQYCPLPAFGLI